jgi:flavin reductase (DIM6/NTAB) family NADH-FMN oxidoreductase RutF
VSLSAVSSIWAYVDLPVWLVTSRSGNSLGGLIATFVNQASIVPECPRVLVGLARQHQTWELVEASGAFALHLLGEEHLDGVWRFGLQSGRDVDKLKGWEIEIGATASPLLKEALGWLDCRVEARLDTGDRTIYLAEVVDAHHRKPGPILTVKRLLQLAPADKLKILKHQLERDIVVDARAIKAWRKQTPPERP